MTPSGGGLLPLSFGLFHQQESIRELTVDIFNELRAYPVSLSPHPNRVQSNQLIYQRITLLYQIGVQFLQSLNHFQRYAYVRQAHTRESKMYKEQQHLHVPPAALYSRTPSNRSESSLGAG